jgi:putative glutathione S-transferase
LAVVALGSIPTPSRLNLPHTPTVPVLWDTKLETIVNNESSEIIRMFNNVR